MFTIRKMSSMDQAIIPQVNAMFDEDMTWDHEQGNIFLQNPDNVLFIAFWEGDDRSDDSTNGKADVVGFLSAHRLQRFDSRKAEVLIYEISVNEPYQRRGIASALIEAVNNWGREVQADVSWVLTNKSNIPAMALYTNTGGVEDDPADVTLFAYTLDYALNTD